MATKNILEGITILGDNLPDDWNAIKDKIKSELKAKRVSVDRFALLCEEQLTIPATVNPDLIRHHFSKTTPSSYAIIDLYLRTLENIK